MARCRYEAKPKVIFTCRYLFSVVAVSKRDLRAASASGSYRLVVGRRFSNAEPSTARTAAGRLGFGAATTCTSSSLLLTLSSKSMNRGWPVASIVVVGFLRQLALALPPRPTPRPLDAPRLPLPSPRPLPPPVLLLLLPPPLFHVLAGDRDVPASIQLGTRQVVFVRGEQAIEARVHGKVKGRESMQCDRYVHLSFFAEHRHWQTGVIA